MSTAPSVSHEYRCQHMYLFLCHRFGRSLFFASALRIQQQQLPRASMDASFHAAKANEWGVSLAVASQYLAHVHENRYFATAIMCPMTMPSPTGPEQGILVATSTAHSTRIQKQNLEQHAAGKGIEKPYWKDLEVHWYPGLAFLNFNGLHDPTYQGRTLPLLFGEYLEQACIRQDVAYYTAPVFGGAVLSPLRDLLRRLGLPVWAEITAGNSFHAYRGLDAYIRIFGAGIESPQEEAHYILNTQYDALQRFLLAPERWWTCDSWVSAGQKPVVAEWNLQLLAAVVSADPAQLHAANRRINTLLNQIRPRL